MLIDANKLFAALYPINGTDQIQIRELSCQENGTKLALSDAIEQALQGLDPELAEVIYLRFGINPITQKLEKALAQLRSNQRSNLRQFCAIHVRRA